MTPTSFSSLGAPHFIDFETVCAGPIEGDLAHTAIEVADAYPATWGPDTLRLCRELVNVKTAAWCWARTTAS
jgi:hypothetical protein